MHTTSQPQAKPFKPWEVFYKSSGRIIATNIPATEAFDTWRGLCLSGLAVDLRRVRPSGPVRVSSRVRNTSN